MNITETGSEVVSTKKKKGRRARLRPDNVMDASQCPSDGHGIHRAGGALCCSHRTDGELRRQFILDEFGKREAVVECNCHRRLSSLRAGDFIERPGLTFVGTRIVLDRPADRNLFQYRMERAADNAGVWRLFKKTHWYARDGRPWRQFFEKAHAAAEASGRYRRTACDLTVWQLLRTPNNNLLAAEPSREGHRTVFRRGLPVLFPGSSTLTQQPGRDCRVFVGGTYCRVFVEGTCGTGERLPEPCERTFALRLNLPVTEWLLPDFRSMGCDALLVVFRPDRHAENAAAMLLVLNVLRFLAFRETLVHRQLALADARSERLAARLRRLGAESMGACGVAGGLRFQDVAGACGVRCHQGKQFQEQTGCTATVGASFIKPGITAGGTGHLECDERSDLQDVRTLALYRLLLARMHALARLAQQSARRFCAGGTT